MDEIDPSEINVEAHFKVVDAFDMPPVHFDPVRAGFTTLVISHTEYKVQVWVELMCIGRGGNLLSLDRLLVGLPIFVRDGVSYEKCVSSSSTTPRPEGEEKGGR